MSDVSLEDIVSLCKRRGFIFQGSEIYGGLAGTWDYGPLGVTLKKNLMDLWWKRFVEDREDMVGVDAAILMNPRTWKASGHVDTFNDPLISCSNCKSRFRTDKFIDSDDYRKFIETLEKNRADFLNWTPVRTTSWMQHEGAFEEQLQLSRGYQGLVPSFYLSEIVKKKCPTCSLLQWKTPSVAFNMMFDTITGPVKNEENIVYLRPETAQGIFTNFKNVLDTLYPDVPFGIAQQGKAFRNEISPRDFVFRSREFNQMEIEYFIHEDNWKELFEKWRADIKVFLEEAGVDMSKVEEAEVAADDLAHYSKRTIDYEFEYPHGHDELLGLAYRTNFDLGNIERESGKKMEYRPKDGSPAFVPHVIEPSFGVERLVMAVLCSAFENDPEHERIVLRLPASIAPVKYCVSPLLKNKPELVAKAREVYAMLKKKYGAVMWDDNGNIGKRYRRQDEIGTPYCVVIDFDTLEDDTVTVRDRDTTEQKRVSISSI